ncbi:MAG: flagellar biosynthetic protein FliR [Paracoccaceae bacterium]
MSAPLWETLAELAQVTQPQVMAAGMVFLRIGAVFALVPGFGERVVPLRVRLVCALAVTMGLAPLVPMAPAPDTPISLALFAVAETLNGSILALALRLSLFAIQIAGTIAAQSTSLAQAFGGTGLDPLAAADRLLTMAALALILTTGFPLRLAVLLVDSYDGLPMGLFPAPAALAEWGTSQAGQAFATGFSLAAPFLIVSMLYNLALGAINRAMPQLMVALVGAPAATWGGLVLLMVAAPFMVMHWASGFARILGDPLAMAPLTAWP